MVISSLTPTKKCAAPCPWCFACFAKQVVLSLWYRISSSVHLRFPKRAYGGAWNGKLVWGRLTHTRVLCMLKNPSYAGVYVFGRYQYHQKISTTGEIQKKM